MLRARFNGSLKYDFRIALKGTEELTLLFVLNAKLVSREYNEIKTS